MAIEKEGEDAPDNVETKTLDDGGHPHGGRLVVAIDVAKVNMVAALATTTAQVAAIISWKAPFENVAVLGILRAFREQGLLVEAVMESSGTYGDVLRAQCSTRPGFCENIQAVSSSAPVFLWMAIFSTIKPGAQALLG